MIDAYTIHKTHNFIEPFIKIICTNHTVGKIYKMIVHKTGIFTI